MPIATYANTGRNRSLALFDMCVIWRIIHGAFVDFPCSGSPGIYGPYQDVRGLGGLFQNAILNLPGLSDVR